jgi:hypothetical protein
MRLLNNNRLYFLDALNMYLLDALYLLYDNRMYLLDALYNYRHVLNRGRLQYYSRRELLDHNTVTIGRLGIANPYAEHTQERNCHCDSITNELHNTAS